MIPPITNYYAPINRSKVTDRPASAYRLLEHWHQCSFLICFNIFSLNRTIHTTPFEVVFRLKPSRLVDQVPMPTSTKGKSTTKEMATFM